MNKVTMSLGLLAALALSGAVASAEECRTEPVDVDTFAICGPFGERSFPVSDPGEFFDGEGTSFVSGTGGVSVILNVRIIPPATSAIALGYDEDGDAACLAQADANVPGLEPCDAEDVITHDVRVFFPDF